MKRVCALIGLAAIALTSCAQAPAAPFEQTTTEALTAPAAAGDYRLGSGDKVRITVFGEPSLSGEFQVSGAGMIALPLIGEVKAVGRTVPEFSAAVEAELRNGYLREPRVNAEVLNHRPYYILGEVTRPGEYPYTNGLTVMNAVATAGGFTYRANTKRVYIKRPSDSRERATPLTSSTPVSPGDTIRIGERLF